LPYESDALYYKETFFCHLKSGILIAIKNPGSDVEKNNKNIIEHKQVLELFKNNKYYDLTIDSQNRLFLNDELQTTDYWDFLAYWNEIHKQNKETQPPLDFTTKADEFDKTSTLWLGKDLRGNCYWSPNFGVTIFNKKGFMFDLFIPNMNDRRTVPALHPSGDIYFIDYDKDEVRLYRIRNTWDVAARQAWYSSNQNAIDPTPIEKKTAKITDNNVRLRDQPDLKGKFLVYLKLNDAVEILDQTHEKMKIDNMEAVWYKVKTKDNIIGWVYGWFVAKDK